MEKDNTMVNWDTSAVIFPGQGSQALGMGKDFVEAYSIARETFEQADDVLGYGLSQLCWDGPEDELNQTINTQPAIYVNSIAIWRVLQQERPDVQPAWTAGHSLGELTALTVAGAMSFEEGLALVYTRSSLMQRAGEETPGAMAALLGLDTDSVHALCKTIADESGKVVVLANDNCPGQVVASGDVEAIDVLVERAADAGAKRAVKLAVSVASHSPLMASALPEFHKKLNETNLSTPQIPVYGNVSASLLHTVDDIREELGHQLTQSVRWTESMQAIIEAGAETFIEVGSKDVLSGLMRRIDRKKARITLNSVDALRAFLDS
jgi:[acyl-carrier-protein] S-malonyltransferase